MRFFRLLSILALTMALLLSACGTSSTGTPAPASPTSSASSSGSGGNRGESLVNSRCTVCHPTDRIKAAKKTKAEWTATVDAMLSRGAQLNAQERVEVIDYLSATYK